jgi:hypothetical protein
VRVTLQISLQRTLQSRVVNYNELNVKRFVQSTLNLNLI